MPLVIAAWQHQAIIEAIAILQTLPDDDHRMRQAINLLDLIEINWREVLAYQRTLPPDPPGKHFRS